MRRISRREKSTEFFGGYHTPSGDNLINLTPHDIKIVVGEYETVIPASGITARVDMTATEQRSLHNSSVRLIPVFYNEPGEVIGLPEPKKGVKYLVSIVVLGATKRPDVFAPDTGATAIRNDKGQIQAVTRLLSAVKKVGKCPCCGLVDDLVEEGALCYLCAEGMVE